MNPVVQVRELRKSYGSTVALDGVSFEVYENEIFGMVGPNGAGKTTTIECIEGLRRADGGRLSVLGLDPRRDGDALRPRIGLQLQESAMQDRIKVWEALELFASLYPRGLDRKALLEQLGLSDKWNAAFSNLSGGQKQRLFIGLALVGDPEVVFLDELTSGLDPQARRPMWDLVRQVRESGKTVFLTTHFMEEAQRLCDRVAIMDHGRIVALDTPEQLIAALGADRRLVFSLNGGFELEPLRSLPGVTGLETAGDRVIVFGQSSEFVGAVVGALTQGGAQFHDLRTEQPTLEDVFLSLTGRELRD